MAETANIAKIAEKLSKELFAEFLWQQTGPWNQNWPCEDHKRHGSKTHPSDVVFYYDEPYNFSRTYVNCDLKSYAKGTINAGNVISAIESLARSLACAEKSDEWRKIYIHGHVSAEICGLLFVYNHDGEYDKDFNLLLGKVTHENLQIPKKSKIIVLGPMDIFWLNNVSYEIVHMRGKEELPSREHCRFFYPHLFQRKMLQLEHAKAATLEMLTAPWIIISYTNPNKNNRRGFIIFYRKRGEFVEEFLYLIDYLMLYQILDSDTDIHIKTLDTDINAPTYFGKAIDQYFHDVGGEKTDIKKKLDSINYSQIKHVQTMFSEIEIGMENV